MTALTAIFRSHGIYGLDSNVHRIKSAHSVNEIALKISPPSRETGSRAGPKGQVDRYPISSHERFAGLGAR